MQLSFLASAAIILSGDVCPQPRPLNQVVYDVPSLSIKANGLSIAHLNVRSLTGKIDQLNLVMSNNKGPDIWTFSETWLSNSIQDEEIHVPGYNCKNANFPLKRKLRGITEAFDLKQLIMEPTRSTEYSETLIDLVFTNSHHKVVESGVFDLGLSDHSLVYCVLKSGRPRVAPKLSNIVHTRTTTKTLSLKILRIFPGMSFLITPTTWTTVLIHGISCFRCRRGPRTN
ncbi:unnamed protein product [Pocillopora meandrina]|uniref:Endonuclease/exonuclease/phosphatase domain-containing protein n=1 Tax=Pocillopora meandrina TaxID=46732 RepID=A0AAU9XZI8_9CNID|nr:unnamed protein product [Pocillopora meandrina]